MRKIGYQVFYFLFILFLILFNFWFESLPGIYKILGIIIVFFLFLAENRLRSKVISQKGMSLSVYMKEYGVWGVIEWFIYLACVFLIGVGIYGWYIKRWDMFVLTTLLGGSVAIGMIYFSYKAKRKKHEIKPLQNPTN